MAEYVRIIQYANIEEVYEYEKAPVRPRTHILTKLEKKRRAELRKFPRPRSWRSKQRALQNFFRICQHNAYWSKTPPRLVTLTFAKDYGYKKHCEFQTAFFRKAKKYLDQPLLSYVSVPERTEAGRIHFHLLMFNLPTQEAELERKTRNLQVLFRRGYVDIGLQFASSEHSAKYMAKYMGKFLGDSQNETKRAYNCSGNILKTTSWTDYGQAVNTDRFDKEITYRTRYLGNCTKKIIIK